MRFETSDGLSLYYEDTGAGTPVLCLPGLTRNARDFDDVAPHLGDVRLLRLVSRGRGASDWDKAYANYAVPIEARDVVEFLDHLGLEKVVILGTSRGGILAMFLAATAKERLAGVVLNDIGPVIEDIGLDRIMDYLGKPPKGRSYAEVAAGLQANMGAEFPDVSLERWAVQAERWFEETADGMALRYDPLLARAVKEAAEAAPAGDLWPLFDALADVPLGVIRGANSDLLTEATLTEMTARRPDMAAATVPNRGHVPFLDEPESLAVIRDVLARV
ncbi:MAG: alpha/beta hydrolase [Pseudomonadota bacterium]